MQILATSRRFETDVRIFRYDVPIPVARNRGSANARALRAVIDRILTVAIDC